MQAQGNSYAHVTHIVTQTQTHTRVQSLVKAAYYAVYHAVCYAVYHAAYDAPSPSCVLCPPVPAPPLELFLFISRGQCG